MEKPRTIEDDPMQRTLQDYVEQMALGVANDVVRGERVEKIHDECKILNSLTNALFAVKY